MRDKKNRSKIDQVEYAKMLLELNKNNLEKIEDKKTTGEILSTRMAWRWGRFWPEEYLNTKYNWKTVLLIAILLLWIVFFK